MNEKREIIAVQTAMQLDIQSKHAWLSVSIVNLQHTVLTLLKLTESISHFAKWTINCLAKCSNIHLYCLQFNKEKINFLINFTLTN